jgi:hypothetical protein
MLDRVAKILFPRSQPWERRIKLNTIIIVLLVGFVFAGIMALALILKNSIGK